MTEILTLSWSFRPASSFGSPRVNVRGERRLHIEDGCPVHRVQVLHVHPQSIDGDDLHVLGRSGERVLNTPAGGRVISPRGWTRMTSRRARSSQVMSTIRSPGCSASNASRTEWSKTSHAGGAPSSGCRGASFRSMSDDSTRPMNVTKACSLLMRSLAPVIANGRRHLMSACGNIRRDRIDPIAS